MIAFPLHASVGHPVLLALGVALNAAITWGYSFLVIFGFPEPYRTPWRRRIALASGALLCVVILAVAMTPPPGLPMPEWLRVVLGLPLIALLFAPFFIATAVVDDARRAIGQYLIGDCIGTWVGIFGYPLFGVFIIQQRVAGVLSALDTKIPPARGGVIAV